VPDAELTRQVQEKEREISELRRRLRTEVDALALIIDITARLNSTLRLDELLKLVMSSAAQLLDGEECSLLLVDETTGDLIFEVSTRADEGLLGSRVPAGKGIAGWVVDRGEAAIVDNPRDDPRFYDSIDSASGVETRSLVAVPLKVKDRVIGVVEVINRRGGERFGQKDLELAQALTNQAAIAIDNARLYAELADAVVTARMSYRLG